VSHADTIRSYLGHRGAHDYSTTLRALDALLAENQRLRDALAAIITYCATLGATPERVADARAALDGTPSATQTLEDPQPTGAAE
jgi:hypothetical protein